MSDALPTSTWSEYAARLRAVHAGRFERRPRAEEPGEDPAGTCEPGGG